MNVANRFSVGKQRHFINRSRKNWQAKTDRKLIKTSAKGHERQFCYRVDRIEAERPELP